MPGIVKKIIMFLLLAVGIGLIVYVAQKGCGDESKYEYEYERIARGDVSKSISATGKLDLFEIVPVPSGVEGVISQIFVDYNSQVRSGDLLAVLSSAKADSGLADYTETYKRTKIELDSVKEFYETKKNLFEEKLVSQKEVDDAKRNYDKALTVFAQAQMAYDKFVSAVNAKKVYAPAAGIILQKNIEKNQYVNFGEVLFVLVPNMKKMKLVLNIDETDVGYVKKGLNVEFSVGAYPDKVFKGTITQVHMNPVQLPSGQASMNASSSLVAYESIVECDNSNMLLRQGMTVNAMINIDTRENVIMIPNSSFMLSPVPMATPIGKKFVWKKNRYCRSNSDETDRSKSRIDRR